MAEEETVSWRNFGLELHKLNIIFLKNFDPSLKKKKKKKKTPFDLEGALNDGETAETPEPAKDENEDIDLESFGKKKKKKKKVLDDEEEKGDEEKNKKKKI